MTILITGISGCIGQTLATQLLAQKQTIAGLDINAAANRLNIPVQQVDITEAAPVQRAIAAIRPTQIVHCAGLMEAKTDDLLQKVNVEGTRHLCEAAAQYAVQRFVHLSSVAVVSGHPETPLTDNMHYRAINAYGESKIAAEKIVLSWREKGLPCAILRPAIVYGEYEYRVLNPFLKAIQQRKLPIMELAEMEAPLQLIYAGNVADALELALTREAALSGTYLLADPETITLRRLLETAYQLLEVPAPIVPRWLSRRLMQNPKIKAKLMELFRPVQYDQRPALQQLGYQPRYHTEPSLKQTILFWKEQQTAQKT